MRKRVKLLTYTVIAAIYVVIHLGILLFMR